MLGYALLFSVAVCSAMLCYAVLYLYSLENFDMLSLSMLGYALLCSVAVCSAMLCYAVLYLDSLNSFDMLYATLYLALRSAV